jgi:predicted MFS family arabinose efflux permease
LSNAPQPAGGQKAIWIVVCLFSILFLGVADNQVLSPLLPAIRADFGKSSHDLGFLFTAYSAAAALSVLLWGPLSDIYGRKRGLTTGLSLFAVGSLVSLLSRSFEWLMIGRVVTGMGASMLSLNTLSYAADFFPYEVRGRAMGSIVSSYFAALIFGVPIGSWVGDRLGWNSVFGIAAATALVLSVWTAFRLPELFLPQNPGTKRETGKISQIAGKFRTYLDFVKARPTFGALLSSLFASAGTMGFLAFLGVWLHDRFGIAGRQIGLIFLASGFAALLASPVAGLISDKIGKRKQFIASNVFLALFLFLLPAVSWGPRLFLVFGAVSLSAAFRQGPMEALLTEIVKPDLRGSFIALKNAFSQLGIGLATMASGLIFERVGYAGVCALGASANLLSAAALIFLVRKRHL